MNFKFHNFKGDGKGWFKCKCGKETDEPERWVKDNCFPTNLRNTKGKKAHRPSWVQGLFVIKQKIPIDD